MLPPLKVPRNFRIIAHRGASGYTPENTLPAFELAARMGISEIELDLQLTTDGEVVICHDLTLARYGHGELKVEALSWAELSGLDMGAWFSPYFFAGERMPRLGELFELYGRQFVYHLEIKGHAAGLVERVGALIKARDLAEKCLITAFELDALVEMGRIFPALPRGWLVDQPTEANVAQARAAGLFQLCPRADLVTPENVALARTAVAEVRAWGVGGDPARVRALIEKLVACQVDGATLNWPDWVEK